MHHEIITSLELDTSILVMMTLRIVKVTRVFAERKRPFCCPPPPLPPCCKGWVIWALAPPVLSVVFIVVCCCFPPGGGGVMGHCVTVSESDWLEGMFKRTSILSRYSVYFQTQLLLGLLHQSFLLCVSQGLCLDLSWKAFVGIRCLCFSVYWHQIQCSPFQVVFMVFGILWLSLSL